MTSIDWTEVVPKPIDKETLAGIFRIGAADAAFLDAEHELMVRINAKYRDAWVLSSTDRRTVLMLHSQGPIAAAYFISACLPLGFNFEGWVQPQETEWIKAALSFGWEWCLASDFIDRHAVDMAQLRSLSHFEPTPSQLFDIPVEGTLH